MLASTNLAQSAELPLCPVCCDLLGRSGGPVTLPCGHNCCLQCAEHIQLHRPECPLCRAPFDAHAPLACNHELRELIAAARVGCIDDEDDDGWHALPDAQATAGHYASELRAAAGPAGSTAGLLLALGGSTAHSLPQSAPSGTQRDVLQLEPPQWQPDSGASHCAGCHKPFQPLRRLRHHCRLCGRIYCAACCGARLLLPPRFRASEPQRVCEMCEGLLAPLQGFLVGAAAASVQPPVHDALDSVSLRSWLNAPYSSSMQVELYKAANILQAYVKAPRFDAERALPAALLSGARGLVLLSAARIGAGWSATAGTGIAVARQRGGGWSAPCAVALAGVGWGLQLGAALADVVLVLRDEGALSSLTAGGASLGLGVSACAAAGPFGRVAAVSLTAGVLAPGANGSTAAVCCARGVLLGAAVEGSAVVPRDAINRAFYGRHVSARALLLDGVVARPPAGALLYDALLSLEQRCMAVGSAQSEQRPPVRRHCSSRSGAAAEASSNSDRRAACHAVAASAPPAPLNVLADLACAAPGRPQCVPAAGGAGAQGSTGGGDGGLAELPAVPQHAAVAAELLDGRREQQQQQQQQQQGSAGTDKAEQEEEEEEEEQQYVLEW